MEVDSVTFVTMIIGNKFAALQELPSYLHLMANITLYWGGNNNAAWTSNVKHVSISCVIWSHGGSEPLPTLSWPLTICWHWHGVFLSQPFLLLIGWLWSKPGSDWLLITPCHWWLAGLHSPLDLLQPDTSQPPVQSHWGVTKIRTLQILSGRDQ